MRLSHAPMDIEAGPAERQSHDQEPDRSSSLGTTFEGPCSSSLAAWLERQGGGLETLKCALLAVNAFRGLTERSRSKVEQQSSKQPLLLGPSNVFSRHGEIYREGVKARCRKAGMLTHTGPHRSEFPPDYSSARCFPAEPASASPDTYTNQERSLGSRLAVPPIPGKGALTSPNSYKVFGRRQ